MNVGIAQMTEQKKAILGPPFTIQLQNQIPALHKRKKCIFFVVFVQNVSQSKANTLLSVS